MVNKRGVVDSSLFLHVSLFLLHLSFIFFSLLLLPRRLLLLPSSFSSSSSSIILCIGASRRWISSSNKLLLLLFGSSFKGKFSFLFLCLRGKSFLHFFILCKFFPYLSWNVKICLCFSYPCC